MDTEFIRNFNATLRKSGVDAASKILPEDVRSLLHPEDVLPPLEYMAALGRNDAIDWLLSLGADINFVSTTDGGALMSASMNCQVDTVHHLIRLGASVNVRDQHRSTPLLKAAETAAELAVQPSEYESYNEALKTVQILLESGAEPNAQDDTGWSSLHYAAYQSSSGYPYAIKLIRCLLDHGADPHLEDFNYESPLQMVQRFEDQESVALSVASLWQTAS